MPERLSVVMPARNETESFRNGFITEVFKSIPDTYEPTVIVAVGDSNPEFVDLTEEMSKKTPNLKVLQLGSGRRNMLAYAYLHGITNAIGDGADNIVEMDASGAHNPSYIPDFAHLIANGKGAAFSSRFSEGGGIERYPLQRKAVSWGGTRAANLLLGIRGHYPDLTSGYQAFRKEVLEDIFSIEKPEDWISVTSGPSHFYQLEMRAKVLWTGAEVGIVPIVWGTNRAKEPTKLPWQTIAKAGVNLIHLRDRRGKFINDKNSNI